MYSKKQDVIFNHINMSCLVLLYHKFFTFHICFKLWNSTKPEKLLLVVSIDDGISHSKEHANKETENVHAGYRS